MSFKFDNTVHNSRVIENVTNCRGLCTAESPRVKRQKNTIQYSSNNGGLFTAESLRVKRQKNTIQ